MAASQTFDDFALPGGTHDVYIIPRVYIDPDADIFFVNGRPVTAFAPHPAVDDLLYLTTGHPETLSFLPDDYWEPGFGFGSRIASA